MSGIVALLEPRGGKVDRALLDSLTESLRPRGPGRRSTWIDGSLGLGHALLDTGARPGGTQPVTVGGEAWIVADARIDARSELIGRLPGGVEAQSKSLTDAELILHAYLAWGEACVEHLLGDFAFAIWDRRKGRLFAARDHFGVRPLYYASTGAGLVLASAIDTVRLHPEVADELDELSIADFLVFGFNFDLGRTSFASVRSVPPAHVLSFDSGTPVVSRYWRLSLPDETRYPRPGDYVDRFDELLRTAVADRVGSGPVGVSMSGGLDSTAVAAACLATSGGVRLRACTITYRQILPDREEHYARLAADSLGVPLEVIVADREDPLERIPDIIANAPEPHYELFDSHLRVVRSLSEQSRIALTGCDGDALLMAWFPAHFRGLLRSGHPRRLARDSLGFVQRKRALPQLGLRTRLTARWRRQSRLRGFPPFLEPSLERRLELRRRWEERMSPRPTTRSVRADALYLLTLPNWQAVFAVYDPMRTGQPLEVAHPLLDLRLVGFALSLPPVPWCVEKAIIRESARDRLPAAVVDRPKTPLQNDLLVAAQRCFRPNWPKLTQFSDRLDRFVETRKVPAIPDAERSAMHWQAFRALSLGWWLQGRGLSR